MAESSIEYLGRLREPSEFGRGIPAQIVLGRESLRLDSNSHFLGEWSTADVAIQRLAGDNFRLLIEGESWIFVAADAERFSIAVDLLAQAEHARSTWSWPQWLTNEVFRLRAIVGLGACALLATGLLIGSIGMSIRASIGLVLAVSGVATFLVPHVAPLNSGEYRHRRTNRSDSHELATDFVPEPTLTELLSEVLASKGTPPHETNVPKDEAEIGGTELDSGVGSFESAPMTDRGRGGAGANRALGRSDSIRMAMDLFGVTPDESAPRQGDPLFVVGPTSESEEPRGQAALSDPASRIPVPSLPEEGGQAPSPVSERTGLWGVNDAAGGRDKSSETVDGAGDGGQSEVGLPVSAPSVLDGVAITVEPWRQSRSKPTGHEWEMNAAASGEDRDSPGGVGKSQPVASLNPIGYRRVLAWLGDVESATRDGDTDEPDDLEQIRGIGPVFANALRSLGHGTFADVWSLDDAAIERVEELVGPIKRRMERDGWRERARALHRARYGGEPGLRGRSESTDGPSGISGLTATN